MRTLAHLIVIIMTSLFTSSLGVVCEYHDMKKKKALWINAGVFSIGFVAGMLFFM